MRQKNLVSLFICLCLCLMVQTASAAPEPGALIQSMTTYMKSLPQFYVAGQANYDQVYLNNNKIQYAVNFDYYVKRPGEFQLNLEGDVQHKQILFNGKSLTIYDEDKAVYAIMDTPATIDEALDKALKEYGMSLALLDVARSNFGANILKDVQKSAYVGKSYVGNLLCHHVAFAKEKLNLQLWIEAGDKPFLRKFLVTFKDNPAMPTWSAEITDWNLSPVLPEGWTTFVPKPGMRKIEFVKPSNQPASAIK